MPIRLLALDHHGTLLNKQGQISKRNRLAIDNAREAGVRVAVVTGRRFRDSRPVALELGLDVPLIAHNGALTKHARTLETVAVLPLPLDAARDALRIGKETGADALLSDDHEGLGVLVFDHLDGENAAAHKYVEWALQIHGDEDGRDAVQQVESLGVHRSWTNSSGFLWWLRADGSISGFTKDQLGERIKLLSTVYATENFTLLDVVNPSASKGAGVAAAAAELQIDREGDHGDW